MSDQLALGLQEHQRGLLAQAVRRYRSVLRAQPDHADALHLHGPLFDRLGDASATSTTATDQHQQ
jgi:Flp pilus assembly protein TadD